MIYHFNMLFNKYYMIRLGGITKRVKEKLKSSKDKVMDTKDKAKDKVTSTKENVSSSSSSYGKQEREFEEGRAGTEVGRKDDPLTSYREKEPMTPAKIKEHEPTAVKREMTEKIVEPGQRGVETNPDEAREKARRSGMTKGTAGADETGSKSEQGAAGTNE
jgi:hypothetical protein